MKRLSEFIKNTAATVESTGAMVIDGLRSAVSSKVAKIFIVGSPVVMGVGCNPDDDNKAPQINLKDKVIQVSTSAQVGDIVDIIKVGPGEDIFDPDGDYVEASIHPNPAQGRTEEGVWDFRLERASDTEIHVKVASVGDGETVLIKEIRATDGKDDAAESISFDMKDEVIGDATFDISFEQFDELAQLGEKLMSGTVSVQGGGSVSSIETSGRDDQLVSLQDLGGGEFEISAAGDIDADPETGGRAKLVLDIIAKDAEGNEIGRYQMNKNRGDVIPDAEHGLQVYDPSDVQNYPGFDDLPAGTPPYMVKKGLMQDAIPNNQQVDYYTQDNLNKQGIVNEANQNAVGQYPGVRRGEAAVAMADSENVFPENYGLIDISGTVVGGIYYLLERSDGLKLEAEKLVEAQEYLAYLIEENFQTTLPSNINIWLSSTDYPLSQGIYAKYREIIATVPVTSEAQLNEEEIFNACRKAVHFAKYSE